MDNQPNTQAFFLVVGNLLRTAVFGKKIYSRLQSCVQNSFFLFFGGPSLCITDQD